MDMSKSSKIFIGRDSIAQAFKDGIISGATLNKCVMASSGILITRTKNGYRYCFISHSLSFDQMIETVKCKEECLRDVLIDF